MAAPSPSLLTTGEMALRLVMATMIGGLLGLDRKLKHKPAGARTHALVALGAAAAALLVIEFPASGSTFDANALTRVIQGILTGIGFLGAGVILRAEQERTVSGLTTAASIWVVACLGIACGVGRWRVALIATALALLVLILGGWIERKLLQHWLDHTPGSH